MNEFSERISATHETRERRFFCATPRFSIRLGVGYRLMLSAVCSLFLLGHGLAMGKNQNRSCFDRLAVERTDRKRCCADSYRNRSTAARVGKLLC